VKLGEISERFQLIDQRIRQYDLKVEHFFTSNLWSVRARRKQHDSMTARALAQMQDGEGSTFRA
jgi:hypothetical protein